MDAADTRQLPGSRATSERSRAESAAWSRFLGAESRHEQRAGWLAVLCSQLPQAQAGLLLLSC